MDPRIKGPKRLSNPTTMKSSFPHRFGRPGWFSDIRIQPKTLINLNEKKIINDSNDNIKS